MQRENEVQHVFLVGAKSSFILNIVEMKLQA